MVLILTVSFVQAPLPVVVGEIDTRVDERLAHDLVRGVVAVLGGAGGRIDGRQAWIGLLDNMTLNQVQRPLPLPLPPSLSLPPSPAPAPAPSRSFASSSRTITAVLRLARR